MSPDIYILFFYLIWSFYFSAALLKTSRNAEIARHVVVAAVPLNIADITQENDYCKGSVS